LEASLDDPFPVFYSLKYTFIYISSGFYWVSGVILFLLLGLSAMISGSEVAFFSLSKEDIHHCNELLARASMKNAASCDK